jgi:hypothetical protein
LERVIFPTRVPGSVIFDVERDMRHVEHAGPCDLGKNAVAGLGIERTLRIIHLKAEQDKIRHPMERTFESLIGHEHLVKQPFEMPGTMIQTNRSGSTA